MRLLILYTVESPIAPVSRALPPNCDHWKLRTYLLQRSKNSPIYDEFLPIYLKKFIKDVAGLYICICDKNWTAPVVLGHNTTASVIFILRQTHNSYFHIFLTISLSLITPFYFAPSKISELRSSFSIHFNIISGFPLTLFRRYASFIVALSEIRLYLLQKFLVKHYRL